MSRTAFITGATSGFGLACARRLASANWNLVLVGRREERLAALEIELLERCKVKTLTLDVRDSEAINHSIETLPEPFKNISLLLNNAGLALGTELAQNCKLSRWQQMIDTNISGVAAVTHALLPTIIRYGKGACIINLGSIAGRWPYPGGNVYCGTKAFVEQFSNALRCDLAGTGVRVTNIAPGLAESEFTLVRTGGDTGAHEELYKGANPIKPEDIADVVYWIATLPPHLNINQLEIMPVSQAWSPLAIYRWYSDIEE
ncbi:SDR family NAD(P)-dependent oxidoreductase [Marinobacterium litorale]|uniref:SDR family NAD(P)-dependent oxidoreductase n=1 Tax=Marinobacterium litorale TaxID=404770 RepID=UPI0009FEC739|nr:SDR family NAD(P)-dependent oxidoreductase [Marinobacterium litorale]